jgi:ATP-dependent RNA helicase DHX8/PRP22
MDAVAKLRHLSLVQKVVVELDNHLSMPDKDLAEFLVDLASTCPSLSSFSASVAESGGGEPFPPALLASIYRAVSAIKSTPSIVPSTPPVRKRARTPEPLPADASPERVSRREKADRIAAMYPGLAVPDSSHMEDDDADDTGDGYDADGSFLGSGIDRARVLRRAADEQAEQERRLGVDRIQSKRHAPPFMQQHRLDGRGGGGGTEVRVGAVLRGRVTKVCDFGAFVALQASPPAQGLVHVSQIRAGVRVEKPADVVRQGQDVWVNVLNVATGRIGLSMKDIDQDSGRDIGHGEARNGDRGGSMAASGAGRQSWQKDEEDEGYRRMRRREREAGFGSSGASGGRAGPISGIPAAFMTNGDRDGAVHGGRVGGLVGRGGGGGNAIGRMRRQVPETELWELQQLAKAGVLTQKQLKIQAGLAPDDEDEEHGGRKQGGGDSSADPTTLLHGDGPGNDNVEEPEIELNEDDPAFLRATHGFDGPSTRTQPLSPVRIVKNPDGSMQRAAMTQSALAKERREMRDEQRAALENQMPDDLNRAWEDPVARERHVAAELRGAVAGPAAIPEWKQQAMGAAPSFGFSHKQDVSIAEQRASLPIAKLKNELLSAFRDNNVLVIIGETGSGKTTQLTQYLAEAGYTRNHKRIGCTQPRRVAAISVAKRVAEEMGCRLGEEVGYAIRFEDMTSADTQIKYMTDGMLLREALTEPDLPQYSVVMIDEAHERTISTDVLFGLLKACVKRRPDLKLICTSATLDAEKFSSYFDNCPIFTIPGRSFPVDVMYAKEPVSDYLDESLITVMQIHLTEPPGDILLFLTGQEEIDTSAEILFERMKSLGPSVPELIILPVYSALPSEMQTRIFDPAPPGSRKVVIATNIAEASLTIDGIYYVVDPGFAKQKVYNPKLGMDSLIVAPISQASAKQRSGRAGRTGPGKCYRLYTEPAFTNEMLPTSVPELQRSNLSHTVLTLKAMGINDLLHFDFMDPPPAPHLISAMESLYALGALDEEGLLTKLGRIMSQFPLDPMVSKMLLASVDLGCSEEILTIVAMLSVTSIFYRPKEKQGPADQKKAKFHQPEGDHLTVLVVYEAWKRNRFSNPWCYENFIQSRSLKHAQDVRKQLITIMDRYKLDIVSAGRNFVQVRKAIVSGFFSHAAKKDPQEGYRTLVDGQPVFIHPSSSLFHTQPEWVMYHEVVLTTKEYMREVMAIESSWLVELAPRFFRVADPDKLSRRKKKERIEPLFDKYAGDDKDAWRLSKRRRA